MDYATPTKTEQVRELLGRAGLGQREAAKELEIDERQLRGYSDGEDVPKIVIFALERLVDMRRQVNA